MPTLETSRSELHALVWSKPTRDCAEQLSISDTGLAKLCKRNDVIRPPRGYWLRKHQRKEPPPLKGEDKKITVNLPERLAQPIEVDIDIPKVPTGGRLHDELVRARSALADARIDIYGRLQSERTDVQVSPKTLVRALALLNVILRTALKLDCKVGMHKGCIELFRGNVSISLNIIEPSKQSLGQVHKLGDYEYVDRTYTPNGLLKFGLLGVYGKGVQREWSDRPGKPLESQVDGIMRGILRGLDRLEAQRIEQEKWEHQSAIRHQQEKRRRLATQLLVERQRRVDRLIDEWQRSKHITEVMDELESQCTAPSPKNRRLIRWARTLARHYDPLDDFSIDGLND